jgi:glycosyltransferase involved in cell wall biosynthesis
MSTLGSIQNSSTKVGIALTDTFASGTVRRVANLFCALNVQNPARYHLFVPEEIFQELNEANYHLERYHNVYALKVRSRWDAKKWENFTLTVDDAGRLLTLREFRNQVTRIVEEENIKVLHTHNDSVYLFGLHPIPGLIQIASLASIETRNYDPRGFFGRLLRLCLRRYDLIDCLSPQIHNYLQRNSIAADKMMVAPNSFVNVQRYRPTTKNTDSVVFATRLHGFKNPDLFVDAMERTYEAHPQVEFFLLGEGPLSEHIAGRLSALRSGIIVHYAFMWDTSTVLNESSINIHLQQEDNYPSQSLLEGMASGNAIIATDVGLTRRLVDEDNGILIPLSDSKALADAMIWMLKHPKATRTMGRRSRDKVLREHTIIRYLGYVNELYDRASRLVRR